VTDLLAPVQRAVGERWQAGACSVTDEHTVTAVVDAALGIVEHNSPPADRRRPMVAVACAETEWHAMPARMLAQLLRERRIPVRFLGPSQPADHLRETLARIRPDVLAVSASTVGALPGAARTIEAASSVGVPTVAGGAAWGGDARRARALGAAGWGADVAAVLRFLDEPRRLTLPRRRNADGEWAFRAVVAAVPDAVAAAAERVAGPPLLAPELERMGAALAAALLVSDPTAVRDHVAWLRAMTAARGVSQTLVSEALQAMATGLPEPAADVLAAAADLTRDAS
jgi:hypothetical protein